MLDKLCLDLEKIDESYFGNVGSSSDGVEGLNLILRHLDHVS